MATFSQLVKMSYKEFVGEKQNGGADTNIMTSAAMARVEKVLCKVHRSNSILTVVNIALTVILVIFSAMLIFIEK